MATIGWAILYTVGFTAIAASVVVLYLFCRDGHPVGYVGLASLALIAIAGALIHLGS